MADDLNKAAQGLAGFGAAAADTASGIENAVNHSFTAVAGTIARAAESGRSSMSQLTASILADFDRIAARQFIAKPIESLLSSVADAILPVAGALAYSQYNFLVKLVMKGIARRAGAPTDTSRDYEFTDWPAVDAFVLAHAGVALAS